MLALFILIIIKIGIFMKATLPMQLAIIGLIALLGYFTTSTLAPEIAFVIATVITGLVFLFLSHDTANTKPASDNTTAKPSKTRSRANNDDLTTLYIGNLAYKVSEKAIIDHFAAHGYVDSVRLMKDRKTGRRKGFGFVEVANDDAQRMIDKLNDTEFSERTLKVRLAKEKGND